MSMKDIDNKKIVELVNSLNKILNMLKSKNPKDRESGWQSIKLLIETGNVNELVKHSKYLRSLLWYRLQGVRDDAWKNLDVYKALSISGIERALTAKSDKIKWSAWNHVLEMINLQITSKDYVRSVRSSFWRLLRSNYATIRKKAWRLLVTLVKEGIFDNENKGRILDFLKHKRANVRILAWKTSLSLLKLGFLSINDLIEYKSYLEDLRKRESKVKKVAEKIIKELG